MPRFQAALAANRALHAITLERVAAERAALSELDRLAAEKRAVLGSCEQQLAQLDTAAASLQQLVGTTGAAVCTFSPHLHCAALGIMPHFSAWWCVGRILVVATAACGGCTAFICWVAPSFTGIGFACQLTVIPSLICILMKHWHVVQAPAATATGGGAAAMETGAAPAATAKVDPRRAARSGAMAPPPVPVAPEPDVDPTAALAAEQLAAMDPHESAKILSDVVNGMPQVLSALLYHITNVLEIRHRAMCDTFPCGAGCARGVQQSARECGGRV